MADSLVEIDLAGQVATTVLVMGQSAGIFAAFCPSWFTVRSDFFQKQESRAGNVAAIRQGEVVGTVLTIGMGLAASALIDTWAPAAGAVLVSAIMVAGYEYSMKHPADGGKGGKK